MRTLPPKLATLFDALRQTSRSWKRRPGRLSLIAIIALLAASLFLNVWLLLHRQSNNDQPSSPETPQIDTSSMEYRQAAAFALEMMKLREKEMEKVEAELQILVPTTSPHPTTRSFPWKTGIVTTVFWIGQRTGIIHRRSQSAWDSNWLQNYGGVDEPETAKRQQYIPAAFIPHQNPFYCALPYNDVTHDQFKPEAPLIIPWFKQAYTAPGQSVCKSRWIAIRKGNRTCYAQWEDCGPFLTDHFQYVFQNERPKPNENHGAGLSVSPAVRDYLGLQPTDVTDWQFVEVREVPPGPWRSYGDNNNFVLARQQMEQRSAEPTPALSPAKE